MFSDDCNCSPDIGSVGLHEHLQVAECGSRGSAGIVLILPVKQAGRYFREGSAGGDICATIFPKLLEIKVLLCEFISTL